MADATGDSFSREPDFAHSTLSTSPPWMIVNKRSPKPRLKETQLRVAHAELIHIIHHPTNVPSSTNNSTFESSAAPDPQVPETFRSFVDQQRPLVTEDNTDDGTLFNTNTLPTHGMGQTTRLLKLAEVFDPSNRHWWNLFKVHRKTHPKKN